MTRERLLQSLDKAFDDRLSVLLEHYCVAIDTIGDKAGFAQFSMHLTTLLNATANVRELVDRMLDQKKT